MTNKRITAITLSWLFAVICMIIIFSFSHQTASVSSETSGGIIQKILDWFGITISQHIIRKTAHALEYFGLCIAFNLAYGFTFFKFCPWLSFFSAAFYASTDEIHQFFVDGRGCQLRDVFVDSCGAMTAVAFCTIAYILIIKIHNKKSEERTCQF